MSHSRDPQGIRNPDDECVWLGVTAAKLLEPAQ